MPVLADATVDWHLDTEPSIRWQVLGDLVEAPRPTLPRNRSKIATEG